jgi:hypothetical protein
MRAKNMTKEKEKRKRKGDRCRLPYWLKTEVCQSRMTACFLNSPSRMGNRKENEEDRFVPSLISREKMGDGEAPAELGRFGVCLVGRKETGKGGVWITTVSGEPRAGFKQNSARVPWLSDSFAYA